MSVTLGWLAVVLAGLGGPNPQKADGPEITYRFRTVEVRGLDWRMARDHGLRPVTSRGGVAVWTAPRDFFNRLPDGTAKEVVGPFSVIGREQAVAHVTARQTQPFVTQASWRGADLPPRETTENVREGMAATVRGRRLDQGILAYVVIEDTEIRAVHTVGIAKDDQACPKATSASACGELPSHPFANIGTAVLTAHCCAAQTTSHACDKPCEPAGSGKQHDTSVTQVSHESNADHDGCAIDWSEAACCAGENANTCTATHQAEAPCCKSGAKAAAPERRVQVQIPEIGRGEIAGEWLIPRDEVLLVGFGPHTIADKDGKAVVRERLAVITAEEVALPTARATTRRPLRLPSRYPSWLAPPRRRLPRPRHRACPSPRCRAGASPRACTPTAPRPTCRPCPTRRRLKSQQVTPRNRGPARKASSPGRTPSRRASHPRPPRRPARTPRPPRPPSRPSAACSARPGCRRLACPTSSS
ncbi:MAG: hypothetical protein U0790_15335 [Isosphaeraceae bacterium]